MEFYNNLKYKLLEKGLKITPQRIIVLEALNKLNHPSADQVLDYIRKIHPGIAKGTVYNILESFSEKGLIKKVKTEEDLMRYDAIIEKHHHLYYQDSNKIEDYFDEELNMLLKEYFTRKNIPGFLIEDIKLQIIGNKEKKRK